MKAPGLFLALLFIAPTASAADGLSSLSGMAHSGLEFGRFFDAAARRSCLPPKSQRRAAPKPEPAPAPFAVMIPTPSERPFRGVFQRLLRRPQKDGYDPLIRSYSERHGLDERLVKSVIAAESEFTTRARSHSGALGLMQLKPETARDMGVTSQSLFDPESNIRAGTAYLAHLFARAWKRYHLKGVSYRDAPAWVLQRIIAAYNAGPRFLARRSLRAQTRHYIQKVLFFYRTRLSELRAVA